MASKRERDLGAAKAARKQDALAESKAAQRRRRLLGASIVAGVLLVVGGYFVVQALADESTSKSSQSPNPSAPPASSSVTPTQTSQVKCAEPGELQSKAQQFPNGPQGITLADATLGLKLTTNCGEIEMEFDRAAPNTSASMIFLANTGAPKCDPPGSDCAGENPTGKIQQVQGYFDNTICHRLTTAGIFVLQCGDPLGNGTGDPGYSIAEENLPKAGEGNYPRGTVAMANRGPGTTGSQFFIVYKESTLPPNYTVLGRVTKGLEIVDKVAKGGVSGGTSDGAPAQPLELRKVLSFERRNILPG